MKNCKICGQEKPLVDFYKQPLNKDGFDNRCKQCMADQQRERIKQNPGKHSACAMRWVKKNPEKMKGYREKRKDKQRIAEKEWVAKNPDKVKAKQKRYRQRHPEKIKEKERQRRISGKAAEAIRRYKTVSREKYLAVVRRRNAKNWLNPTFRISRTVSIRINDSLSGRKNYRCWQALVGFGLDELRKHLEGQFAEGMTWENHGDWHIDHRRPIASFDFASPEDPGFKKCWALDNLQPLWATENMSKGARYADPVQSI